MKCYRNHAASGDRGRRTRSVPVLAGMLTLGLLLQPASHALTLPDKPLLIPGSGVLPNVIVTFDNSKVSLKGSSDSLNNEGDTKRYHYSAAYNTLYYDPTRRYQPPPGYRDQDFNAACLYFNSYCTINLATQYRGTLAYSPPATNNPDMWHPACDSSNRSPNNCSAESVVCSGMSCPFRNRTERTHAYYYRRDTSLPKCDASDPQDEDCYQYVPVGSPEDQALGGYSPDEAKRNFANWYSYYRTAQMTAISAMLRAFPKLEGKVRLAWQAHGRPTDHTPTCAGFGKEISGQPDWHRECSITRDGTPRPYDTRRKTFEAAHKDDFYNWLVDIAYAPPPPNTARAAMIRAAEYFMRDNAYRDDPRDANSPIRSCRANYHVMFNGPGWSNRDNEVNERNIETRVRRYPCLGKHLDVCTSLPRPVSALQPSPSGWLPRAPYRMNPSNNDWTGWGVNRNGDQIVAQTVAYSLGSLALYYWATDLHSGLANNVPPYLADESGGFDAQFWNPRNDPATWQHMVNFLVVNTSPAALGSDWQGDRYSGPILAGSKGWPYVSTDSGLTPRAFVYDFWRAAVNSRGLFLPAENVDEVVQALTQTVEAIQARATSASALASSIASTERISGTHIYKAGFYATDSSGELAAYALDSSGRPQETPEWMAALPSPSGRKIYTWNGSGGTSFTWEGLAGGQRVAFDDTIQGVANAVVDDAAKAKEVLAWLRGDQSREAPSGPYRKRTRLLGDIVNSDPLYVGDEATPSLFRLTSEGASYRSFLAYKNKRPKLVYIGANDGMVHAFVAGAGAGGNICGASALGQEVFAYVPGRLVGELPHLAKPDYSHRFYVDGPLFAGDAHLGNDPDPANDGRNWRTILLGGLGNGGRAIFALDVTDPCAFDAGKVLWEYTSADDGDLGYTHARPLTAKLNNGQWAAIVANGYNSANGHAVLFLLDLKTGAVIRKIDADAGAGSLDNGLMTPTLRDSNGDGTVDYVYAGDNLGRLWKFDLSSANPNDWRVAYAGQPLFSTGGAPISAAPRLGGPPPGVSGVMVYVGSGRMVTNTDVTDTTSRGIYAVLDTGAANLSPTDLVAQTITTTSVVAGRTVRRATRNAVDYTTHKGWYLPLGGGERVIAPAQFVSGRILFTSVSPSSDPGSAGGESWVYELEPLTGGMAQSSIFQLTDTPVELAALKLKGLSKSAIFLRDYGVDKGVMLSQDITGKTNQVDFSLSVLRLGRVSWREIID